MTRTLTTTGKTRTTRKTIKPQAAQALLFRGVTMRFDEEGDFDDDEEDYDDDYDEDVDEDDD